MKIKTSVKKGVYLVKETVNEALEDNVMKLSAALSYYTIFSLPPLLIILISLAGVFFGEDAVRGTLFAQINGLVGNEAAGQIQEAIKNVKLSGNSTFATGLSISILVVGASGVFAEIQDSINFIWGVKAKPKKGFIKFLKNRLMSFSMIATVGFLLMVGLVVNTVMDVLSSKLLESFSQDWVYLSFVLNYVLLFVILTTLFTVIFRALPDGKVVLRDCIIGAAVTTVLFMLGKFAIGFYLGSAAIGSVYGAAGSILLILVWVYYSAIILFFGAEFTKVYAITHGKNIVPNQYTVKVAKEIVEV